MKLRTLVAGSAVLLAIAGSAVAQMASNPEAAQTSAYSGPEMAVSGAVVSSSSTELVLDADTGKRLTFVLDGKTFPTRTFNLGERASVRYHSMIGGAGLHAAGVALEPLAKVETSATVDTTTSVETRSNDTTTANTSELPDTASALPLVALFGLLALGGAIVLRVART